MSRRWIWSSGSLFDWGLTLFQNPRTGRYHLLVDNWRTGREWRVF